MMRDEPPDASSEDNRPAPADRMQDEFETVPASAPAEMPGDEPAVEPPTAAADAPNGPLSGPPSEAEAVPAAPAVPSEPLTAASPAHSVPATPVGDSTQCPRCGTENRPGVAFCRSCGQRLMAPGTAATVQRPGAPQGTVQCPRCGTHNRPGVAFCQNCGANLRATAGPAPAQVPPPEGPRGLAPTVAGISPAAAPPAGHAVLGPIVLLIGAIGIGTGWALPFPWGAGSLWDRSFGAPGGYGIALWDGYAAVTGGLLERAYFGFAAAAPLLVLLLVVLAAAGFLRASPGAAQLAGLLVALAWAIALVVLFVIVELAGNWTGDVVGLLRAMSPAGIIFLLAGLIVVIGSLTRLGRS